MEFDFHLDNPELPPRPPRLPRPKPWFTIFVVGWNLTFGMWLFRQPYRIPVFASGFMVALAIYQAAEYLKLLVGRTRLQREMDKAYDSMIEHLKMLPKLAERHGPEEALEIMRMADHLVDEGDFPDLREAVASIERHHDMEPTVYDD
jgi:hypothetical protein